ncbi:MAG: delta-60 repeat domain-containing protein, partial [Anaerolineae bacterium]
LALQADGKIVVGGGFTHIGGQERTRMARLTNDAALQGLSVDAAGTSITWMRSGTGPEVWYVTFERSADGVNYTPLGNGTRTAAGWRLSGQNLPRGQNLYLRARGYYAASVVESVRLVYMPIYRLYLPLVLR